MTGQSIRRVMIGDKVFLSVEDMIYLSEQSRDRFRIEGNGHAAAAMERLTFVLSMLCLVQETV